MSLIKKINEFYKQNKNKRPVLFTTPSHSQGEFIPPDAKKILGKNFYKNDFSEIDGFDNLRNPRGILKNLQKKLSNIYNSKNTFILTQGSSSGIIAAIKTVLKQNDKVLIARNCHISVYNGLVLSGAKPIWFYPDINSNWGIFESVNPELIERELSKDSDIKALILTSPTYEGIYSDIARISEICHKHNVTIIVDEAHGALNNFTKSMNQTAIIDGADISIQSLHKTAGAPNPCALLHLGKNTPINSSDIQDSLNLINTTSPSYPLIAAIEATVDFLNSKHGQKTINELEKNINNFKKKLNKNISVYSNNDITKLLLKINDSSQLEIADCLNEKFNIEEEMSTDKSILFITGIGTNRKKLQYLLNALNKIASNSSNYSQTTSFYKPHEIITALTPQVAFDTTKTEIYTIDAIGKISGEIVMQYPPGIPVLLPGEFISESNIHAINKNKIKICI